MSPAAKDPSRRQAGAARARESAKRTYAKRAAHDPQKLAFAVRIVRAGLDEGLVTVSDLLTADEIAAALAAGDSGSGAAG